MQALNYIDCPKQGYHKGEKLNVICMEPGCSKKSLCCCVCIEQEHQGHKTKTLKKLIVDAQVSAKEIQKVQKKESAKEASNPQPFMSEDVLRGMIESEEQESINKFKKFKDQLLFQVDALEKNIHTYFKQLLEVASHKKNHKADPNAVKAKIYECIQSIQGSKEEQQMQKYVTSLLDSVDSAQGFESSSGVPHFEAPTAESYQKYISNSNKQVGLILNEKLFKVNETVTKQNQRMQQILQKIPTFWDNQIYEFSPTCHHQSVSLKGPHVVKFNAEGVYQPAIMEPTLAFNQEVESLRFKISICDLPWVAVGVCFPDIVQSHNYFFNFTELNHGCYMVSANGGSWSSHASERNNVVKSFMFKEGDSITCAVRKNKIIFMKDKSQDQGLAAQIQQQFYSLDIKNPNNLDLAPCVVGHYKNTEVEYCPSFSSQKSMDDLPALKYKFQKQLCHPNIQVKNESQAINQGVTGNYNVCVASEPIEDISLEKKSVAFRLNRCGYEWVAVGFCHKKMVQANDFNFAFQNIGHGHYMISSNGGSWSNIQPEFNNVIRTFKMIEGDLVVCELNQERRKAVFRVLNEKYEMDYKPKENDPLYPVVVFYYQGDEVEVLPTLKE